MANNLLFKLAACLLLLTVLKGGVSVEACQQEDQDCSSLSCCAGLECVEVSSGVFQCEPEGCEDHAGHPCEPGVRECCEGLKCVAIDAQGNYECKVA